jgi:putative FmdB family regulatory protein
MPTYHYRCSACGHEFEQFQKFIEDALTDCPVCAGAIRRVPQPVGIVFKGAGWYITDSRNNNGKSAGGEESKPASEPKPKAGTGTDSKSDAKPAVAESDTKKAPAGAAAKST